MKKGCFLLAITLFTIIIMIGMYFIKTNKEIFYNFGKKKVVENIGKEMKKELLKVKASPYKDSLYNMFKNHLYSISISDFENSIDSINIVTKQFKKLIRDSIIDSTDYSEFKMSVRRNEKSSKNGN